MNRCALSLYEYEKNIALQTSIKKFFMITLMVLIIKITFVLNIPKTLYSVEINSLTEPIGYLTNRDYEIIEQNYKYYYWASKKVGIPIEILIAIHYRESNLRMGYYSKKKKVLIKNIGGPFMLDRGGDETPDFDLNIRRYEHMVAQKYNYKGDTRVSHNFEFACLVAANEIKSKNRYGFNNEHGIADTFWGYNGRVRGSYLNSAYVCSDPKNGNILVFKLKDKTITDTRPGCLLIWKELKASEKFQAIVQKYN